MLGSLWLLTASMLHFMCYFCELLSTACEERLSFRKGNREVSFILHMQGAEMCVA